MTTEYDWRTQVGRSWAQNHARTDRAFAGLTQALLDRLAAQPGSAVLDVGCGAGELTLAIARQRARAQVVGVDISADLIEAANARTGQLANIRFVEADAGTWCDSDFAPELIVSRHGVMFFDDPPAAFAHLRTGMAGDGRLLFSCFRAPGENPWASDLAQLLGVPPASNPHAPGPFAFADPGRVEMILESAGWRDVAIEAVDFAYVAGSAEDPVEDALQLFRRIGPAAAALRALEGEELGRAEDRIRHWLERHRSGNLVAMAAAAWIVTAHAG